MTEQIVTKEIAEVKPPETTVTLPETQEEKKFTQADIDRIVKDRLAREKEQAKEAERIALAKAESDALVKNQEWEKLAAQREKELKQAKAELDNLKLQELKREIATTTGLPPVLAMRLVGTTQAEIEADAKTLVENLPKKTAPTLSPTNPGGASTGETDAERRKRLLG